MGRYLVSSLETFYVYSNTEINISIAKWVKHAVSKIGTMLDDLYLRRRDESIRWDNLEINNEADFLKGYLFCAIQVSVALSSERVFPDIPLSLPDYVFAYKVIANHADEINKAIADKLESL